MRLTQKTLYGIVAILVALLLIATTIAIYYSVQYGQESSTSSSLASELNAANEKYNATASEYNLLVAKYGDSLASFQAAVLLYNQSVSTFNNLSSDFGSLSSDYNGTLKLLVSAVSVLNTSNPAYQNASKSMTGLWTRYNSLASSYENVVKEYEFLFQEFQISITHYEQENNVTLSGQLLVPVKPIATNLLSSNLLIQFANSTYVWINDTSIQAGWNAYIFTVIATGGRVNATWYPQFGEHFVTAIDGAKQTSSAFWFFWQYNGTGWQLGETGPDPVTVLNDTTYAWTLCGENMSTFLPTCTPR